MKEHTFSQNHHIDSLFSFLLSGALLLFLIFLLLSGIRIYQKTSENLSENQNLRTAAAYLTTKFRQHDTQSEISLQSLNGTELLCFYTTIDETEYMTCIYLMDHALKELFTEVSSPAPLSMGTTIAKLDHFSVKEQSDGFFQISLTDLHGKTSTLLLHNGAPTLE